MKSHRTPAVYSLIAVLTIAAIASLGFSSDALAAIPALKPAASHVYDVVTMATLSLAGLRMQVADIMTRANAKMAEAVEGLDVEALRKIEAEHAAILKEADPIRAQITEEERKLAAPPEPAEATGPTAEDERKRTTAILDLAERHGQMTLGRKAITDNLSLDAFRASLLDKIVAKEPVVDSNARAEVSGRDETQTRRDAVADYLFARGDFNRESKLNDAARQYRGMRLIRLAEECLSWRGISVRGLTDNEIAARALTTSDFPLLLSNVVNKELRAAYEAAPQTFRPWTRQMTLSDFKKAFILRKGLAPQLERLNERGEYKMGAFAESQEDIALSTYGIMVAMTRQMILNDDLGAFRAVPSEFGQASATLESDIVWGKLLANPTLKQDNTALFAAGHNNNTTGAGSVLASDAINAVRVKMAKQKDLDGDTTLNITPTFLLIPPELEFSAAQILAPLNSAQTSQVVPDFIRSLTPISEARLSNGIQKATKLGIDVAGSATQWFLASTQVDTIVYATLTGQNGPYVESEMSFDVDGVRTKCRHDFAAEAADFRGLQRSVGA
jgi:hypothetical protein